MPTANRIVTGGPPGTAGVYIWVDPYWEGPWIMNRLQRVPSGTPPHWELTYYNSDEDNVLTFATGTPLTDLPEQATWDNGVTVTRESTGPEDGGRPYAPTNLQLVP